MTLFRKEALAGRQNRWLGEIVLVRPLPLTLLTGVAVAFALALLALLIWGSYTKRTTVSGMLVPHGGLVKLYAPEPATVLERHVAEGQAVRRGDTLFVLSGERRSAMLGETHAAIVRQVEQRQASLRSEIAQTRRLHTQETAGLQARLRTMEQEAARLDDQLALQRDRVALARTTVARYEALMRQDYIAREQLQQKQEELLDVQAGQRALQRERLSLGREIDAHRTELDGLAARHDNQIAQLDRSLAALDQERLETEARRSLVLAAPRDGQATAVLAEAGQTVGSERPLLSIVPQDAPLHAELYAPSRAIGFVRTGDPVRLRFAAYPYQKFGHQTGVVQSVALTALPRDEWDAVRSSTGAAGNEPLYRIIVSLARQSMPAYGAEHALQAGMTLEADILHENLKLYEWVLEPLRTLSGKL
ncbi:HlyD family efflux transporter periplasmic adaptor subunit [Verticiella sediminum]|uniref:HlyD family efflux transporter periplasmic adaptor subunit n=1 Tax=Verticiella sediminum TaxID=1247510 RepID=A0A556A6H0_9BURK|nr:HlyD family efflux transporter periplasmic adaptor subunit [Verticiella sediminum]TSH88491.1 HlyD family efflux transporter periplasmic adaptor subunit [Verticiella sediminum]